MDSCYNHLNSKQKQEDGSFKPYYQRVVEETVVNIKTDISNHLKEGLEKNLLARMSLMLWTLGIKLLPSFKKFIKFINNI